MQPRVRGWLVAVSALLSVVGAAVMLVYFFQPWRSCEYEDTTAGCAMLPPDAVAMGVATIVTIAAIGVLAIALVSRERSTGRSHP